jgi:hypothetical protein
MPQPDFGDESGYQSPSREQLEPQEPPPHIPGIGSGYAVNQAMARGEVQKPMSLAAARKEMGSQQPRRQGPLSPETVELLKMQADQTQATQPEPNKQEQQAPGVNKQKLAESEEEIASENRIDLADLPLDAIAALRDDMIYNDKRRKEIEARLQPLDIADLVTRREIQQEVAVIPNKLIYTLRTMNEQELLFCMQYVYEFPGSARYVEELLNMARLVCGFMALNGRMLPDHRKKAGTLDEEVDKDAFVRKLKLVTLYPTNLIADLGANYHWFVGRVNKLFSAETLKNG